MVDYRHHRVPPIDRALLDPVTGMGMDVGQHLKSLLTADLPESGISLRMKVTPPDLRASGSRSS